MSTCVLTFSPCGILVKAHPSTLSLVHASISKQVTDAPTELLLPSGQLSQALESAPPEEGLKEPASQGTHASRVAAEYVPLGQAEQTPALVAAGIALIFPAAHISQLAMLVAPTALLYRPATHSEHWEAPSV
jgi:hypothetical protein